MALLNCNFCSSVLGMDTQVTVILPEHRHQPRKAEEKKYPVIYALHGLGRDHTNWLRGGQLDYHMENREAIVIMPDCAKSFYVDGKYGYDYFTYLTEELPLIVANYFPASTKREDTYIAGISMGGYGALHAAFRRPDLYGAVATFSAACDPYSIPTESLVNTYFCRDSLQNIDNMFGNADVFHASVDHLPNALKACLRSGQPIPRIFMTCGRQDLAFPMNEQFRDQAMEMGAVVEWHEDDGIHDWAFWNKVLPNMLEFFGL